MICQFCNLRHDPEKSNCNDPRTGALIRRRGPVDTKPNNSDLLEALLELREALDQRYDGAEDSGTRWMGEWLEKIDRLLPEGK